MAFIFFKHFRRFVYIAAVHHMFSAVFSIFLAFIVSVTAGQISAGDIAAEWLDILILALPLVLLCVLLYFFITYLLKSRVDIAGNKYSQKFKESFYKALLKKETYHTKKITTSDFRIIFENHIEVVINFYTNTFPKGVAGIFIGSLYLIYFFYVNVYIAFVLLGLSLVKIIPSLIVKKYITRDYDAINETGLQWVSFVAEALKGLMTIKTFVLEKWYISKLGQINKNQVKAYSQKFVHVGQEEALNSISDNIATFVTYFIMGFFIVNGFIGLEVALVFIVLAKSFFDSTSSVFLGIPRFFEYRKAVEKISPIYDKRILGSKTQLSDHPKKEIVLEIRELTFRYNDESAEVFRSFSLSVKKGEKVAFVGENGSGKTTLIELILGSLKGYGGKIQFLGKCIEECGEEAVLDFISYLPQNDPLLDISVEEVLLLFADYEDIENIALKTLDLDLKPLKGNSISSLSGGERKRLFLSICLGRQSQFLILDEPTNNLDSNTRKLLIEVIKNLDKSTIIITHDDELALCCDRIVNF